MSKKKIDLYFVAEIVSMPNLGDGMMLIHDDTKFIGKSYEQAYKKAMQKLRTPAVQSVLIFSSNGTTAVISYNHKK